MGDAPLPSGEDRGGLDVISSEFKGILMDLHSAFGGENSNSNDNSKGEGEGMEVEIVGEAGPSSDGAAATATAMETTERGNETEIEETPKGPVSKIRLHVANLPTGFSEDSIAGLFDPFGTVVKCDTFPYMNFAYVELDSESGGFEAIKELNKLKIGGKTLSVMKSRLNTRGEPILAYVDGDVEEVATFKVYMAGIADDVGKAAVKKLAEEYGRVVDIEVYRKNAAFVHMEEEEAGRRIISELNGKIVPQIGKKPLQVTVSKNPEGPSMATVKLQMKNFPEDLTADQIRGFFQPYGLVLKCVLHKSKFDLLRKAEVHLEQLGDIRSAIKELCELELVSGKKVVVEPAKEMMYGKPQSQPAYAGNHLESVPPPRSKKPKSIGRGPLYCSEPSYSYDYGTSDYSMDYDPPPNYDYGYQPALPPVRPMRGMRGGMGPVRARGYGDPYYGQFNAEPERILREPPPAPNFRGRGRGGRGRGMVKGRGMGARHSVSDLEYGFDEYYDEPKAVSARDHYSKLQEEYEQFACQISSAAAPMRKFKKKIPPLMAQEPGSISAPPPAHVQSDYNFADDVDIDNYSTLPDASQVPYASHKQQHPSLNLPIGEREYYSGAKGGGESKQQPQNIKEVTSFLQQQMKIAAGYVNNQVSSSGYTSDTFASSGVDYYQQGFNAVPFNYANVKQKSNYTNFAKDPVIKAGGKVYTNKAGRVMVRGNRGGKNKKRPGLGTKGQPQTPQENPNMIPLGGGGASFAAAPGPSTAAPSFPSYPTNFSSRPNNNFKKTKFKSKQEVKDDNQEYTDWLQSKAWLHQPIAGIVRPAKKN